MRKRTTATFLTSALAVAALATPASAAHEGSVYEATLSELNDSGASGTATITVSDDGETMTVQLNATGLADFPHAQHIHGIVTDGNVESSTCPPDSADSNGDGVIDVAEGAPFYGGVQVSLTTEGDTSGDSALAVERYPSGTTISYTRSGIDIPDELKPNLGKLHLVVHGVDENGDGQLNMDQEERSSLTDDLPREATLPALCGTLAATATTVQTGMGGTADTGTDTAAIALGGLAVLGLAGTALRRRGEQA